MPGIERFRAIPREGNDHARNISLSCEMKIIRASGKTRTTRLLQWYYNGIMQNGIIMVFAGTSSLESFFSVLLRPFDSRYTCIRVVVNR